MRNRGNKRGPLGVSAVVSSGLVVVFSAIVALAGSGTAAGQPASPPVNTSLPSISGSAREGNTLTASAGRWSGTEPISFAGVWRRCDSRGEACSSIPGTSNKYQYRLTSEDVGRRVRVTVTAQNKDGTASATSRPTGVVAAAPPVAPRNVSAPAIVAGTAQEGLTLVGDIGRWEGTQPIRYDLFWQRCNHNGTSCPNISRAHSTRYTLGSGDVGNRMRFVVRAVNRGGRTNAYSSLTAVVAAKGPSLPPGAVKLPDGKYSIPVTSVSPPERLVIGELSFSPNPLRVRSDMITARFRIADTRGYIVRTALVFVTPLPYGWVTQPAETMSATDGWATVTMRAHPQLPRKAAIVMFVRARKAGDFVLTGVSNRRLVQMLVDIA